MFKSQEELDDFIKTYEKAFGERLTPEQAYDLMARLMHLYRRIRRVSDGERVEHGGDDGEELPIID